MMLEICEKHLGHAGAMLSGSKHNPPGTEDHTIYWNACVFVRHSPKTILREWWGDLDVTAHMNDLQALTNELGLQVYVTPEQPWRFDGFKDAYRKYKRAKRGPYGQYEREIFHFKPHK